jgi:Protein tyrosine and serine/threonine kinase
MCEQTNNNGVCNDMNGLYDKACPPQPSSALDGIKLRRVLRVVHCLQKERGASCALYALGFEHPRLTRLIPARRHTDQALSILMGTKSQQNSHNWVHGSKKPTSSTTNLLTILPRALGKIRRMIAVTESSTHVPDPTNIHRVMTCFNTLVSTVIHEHVLRGTAQLRKLNSDPQQQQQMQPDVLYYQQKLQPNKDSCSSLKSMPRVSSCIAFNDIEVIDEQPQRRLSEGPLGYDFSPLEWETQNRINGNTTPDSRSVIHSTSNASLQHHQVNTLQSVPSHAHYNDENDWLPLLDLLDVFVQLKENTGRERAIFSCMLAIQPSPLLLNSLVMEVEQQRYQLDRLSRLPTGPLRNLVQELVTLSPELQALQDRILLSSASPNELNANFLWSDPNVDAGQLWEILTCYIDKLHSLELLIVEELECSAPQSGADSDDSSQSICRVSSDMSKNMVVNDSNQHHPWQKLLGSVATSEEDLKQKITNMSPNDLKQWLLTSLSQDTNSNGHHHMTTQPQIDIPAKSESPIEYGSESLNRVEDLLRQLTQTPASKEWEIDLYEIKFLKRIGQGTAGTTYLADWNGLQVAVKVASITEMGLDGWRTEAQALQKLHHPNIIRLLGSVYHPNPLTFCLVLEYCNAGDLAMALKKVTPVNFFWHVASSIAKGMQYLHHRGIIHRDVKPSNVLLDGDFATGHFQVKVNDFGVATETNGSEDKTAETGTYRWMAPEVIRHEAYTQTADVYSFAVVLWQLLTHEDPFADISQIAAAGAVATEECRPIFPSETPKDVRSLIEACWSQNAESRPSFDEIVIQLHDLEMSMSEADKKWLEAPLGHPVYQRSMVTLKQEIKVDLADKSDQLDVKAAMNDDKKDGRKKDKRGAIRSLFSRKSSYF